MKNSYFSRSFGFFVRIFFLASVTVLTACGGGGGESSVSASVVPSVPVTTVTVADALAELNRTRVASGIPALTMNAELTKAATNHATYMAGIAPTQLTHSEDSSKAGFTGATVIDRILAAGYISPAAVNEDLAFTSLTGDPVKSLNILLSVPYHGLTLAGNYRDFGMGYVSGQGGVFAVIELGSKNGEFVNIPATEVRMWPCGGVGNIFTKNLAPESPNPIPGRDIGVNPIGTPIYVYVTSTNKLELISYDVRSSAGPVAIAKVLGQDIADGLGANASGQAILPDKPLLANTTYTATVTGKNNGQAFTKACSFTTGSQ